MKKIFLCLFVILSFVGVTSYADDVEYSINNYDGVLKIHQDNTADFYQTITYNFTSNYNGQIVTLGEAGHMPTGFKVDDDPEVSVKTLNRKENDSIESDVENLGDGYEVTIYNSGNRGDIVKVKIHWKLSKILYSYQDIVELNWVPISDWDRPLKKVNFKVITDKTISDSQMWVHAGYVQLPKVKKLSNGYQIVAKNVNGKLELHGYWKKTVIGESTFLPWKRKEDIIEQENKLSYIRMLYKILFCFVFPVPYFIYVIVWGYMHGTLGNEMMFLCYYFVPLLMIIVSFIRNNLYEKAARPTMKYSYIDKKAYSFELPEYIPPLVLLRYLYDDKVNDMGKESFKKAMQATLLDFIDRKVITIEEKNYLLRHDDRDRKQFEDIILNMAFGDKQKIEVNQLFAEYYFDENKVKEYKKKYKGEQRTKKLKKLSLEFNSRLRPKLREIDKSIKNVLSKKRFPKLYRRVTPEEFKEINSSGKIFVIGFIPFLICGYYLFKTNNYYVYLYGVELIIVVFIVFLKTRSIGLYNLEKVKTKEGQQIIQSWTSFVNMLRNIDKFDKVDIEGVVVWNRILVYATLFNCAKKVQDFLDINDIKIADDFETLSSLNNGLSDTFNTKVSLFAESMNSAGEISEHFSVSSGGSGSSSSSDFGGFSGGGGGGGGGAF
ncbi:signal peptide protein [Streptococcus equinus ATCC 33317]|uniref:DUF2207 domain-containing protein n=1 Tax=Streptococcus equinus TaxID=1335 RepID=UPI0005050AF1|nr:DUF2207 domain-containing protein [Streptococcus equinus]KFN85634.1 signal peptide protein [Streptococcus equinus ATCC 33317]